MTSAGPPPRSDVTVTLALLREIGTFPGATERDLRTIAETGVTVTVPQGWSLIWERTPADKAYVVLRGELEVRVGEETIARLGAGDITGERGILNRRLRSATVVAASPLTVLHFTREQVERLHGEVPAFRAAMDAAVVEHTA